MLGLNIRVEDDAALNVKRADANRMLKRVLQAVGVRWHKIYRPRHFAMTAYSRYGYTPRAKKYNSFKKRKLGHVLPLVYTGVSRELAGGATIRATSKGVAVTMPARQLNRRPKNSQVDKAAELRRVSLDEAQELQQFAVRNLERRIKRYQRALAAGDI